MKIKLLTTIAYDFENDEGVSETEVVGEYETEVPADLDNFADDHAGLVYNSLRHIKEDYIKLLARLTAWENGEDDE